MTKVNVLVIIWVTDRGQLEHGCVIQRSIYEPYDFFHDWGYCIDDYLGEEWISIRMWLCHPKRQLRTKRGESHGFLKLMPIH